MGRGTPGRMLVLGALVVGVLDGLDAVLFFYLRSGVPPLRIFQAIAGGLLGRSAFDGGLATALIGLALHFFIASVIVLTYFIAARRLATLSRHPVPWGLAYGLLVYGVMTLVVVPLSAAASGRPPLPVLVNGVLIHLIGVGIPAAVFGARAARRAPSRSGMT